MKKILVVLFLTLIIFLLSCSSGGEIPSIDVARYSISWGNTIYFANGYLHQNNQIILKDAYRPLITYINNGANYQKVDGLLYLPYDRAITITERHTEDK